MSHPQHPLYLGASGADGGRLVEWGTLLNRPTALVDPLPHPPNNRFLKLQEVIPQQGNPYSEMAWGTVSWTEVQNKPNVLIRPTGGLANQVLGLDNFGNLAWLTPSGGGTVDWSQITGKPTTFPPSPHMHPWTDITGVPNFARRDVPNDFTLGPNRFSGGHVRMFGYNGTYGQSNFDPYDFFVEPSGVFTSSTGEPDGNYRVAKVVISTSNPSGVAPKGTIWCKY